jgi:hypothetical protein
LPNGSLLRRRTARRSLDDRVARAREVPLLVELAVVRQVGLGHDAQDDAVDAITMRGVVQPRLGQPQRRADDQNGKELAGRRHDPGDRLLDLVEERVLQQQVLDGVGRQPELGKDHEGRPGLVALAGQAQRLGEIVGGVGDAGARNAARHSHEVV